MSAIVIPFDKKQLKCSFCNRTESQVKRMMKGKNGCICDKCLAKATERANSVPCTHA